MLIIFFATAGVYSKYVKSQDSTGALPAIINRHNYGYTLTKVREVQVATYVAKLLFHIFLPEWNTTFNNEDHQCVGGNYTRTCLRIERLFQTIKNMRMKLQNHMQQTVRRIHEITQDLPIHKVRQRRGLFTNILSRVTGLASQEQLQSVRDVLERIETGVYKAAEMFGQGSRSLLASFQIEQKRIANFVRILTLYRKSISTIQREMLRAINWDRTGFALFCEVTKLLLDMQYKMAEADNLYSAMQFLMAGNIPHFLISHKLMAKSLILVEDHLQITEPHMTLVRHDFAYYYSQAPFKTFMVGNVLFIIIDAPVTNNALKEVFSVYELTRLIDLIHPPNCYRFVINKAEINLHLVETNLFANLYWNNGVFC